MTSQFVPLLVTSDLWGIIVPNHVEIGMFSLEGTNLCRVEHGSFETCGGNLILINFIEYIIRGKKNKKKVIYLQ